MLKPINVVIGLVVISLMITAGVVSPVYAGFYPNRGTLWYNGSNYVETYLLWSSPGGWSVSDPGYENDLVIDKAYFKSCWTVTNLPNGYDDCPTAGVSEKNPTQYSFAFGSFHAKNIRANYWYFGVWQFTIGPAQSSYFYVSAQEVKHYTCWWDNIWCMQDTGQSITLINGTLNWSKQYFNSWNK